MANSGVPRAGSLTQLFRTVVSMTTANGIAGENRTKASEMLMSVFICQDFLSRIFKIGVLLIVFPFFIFSFIYFHLPFFVYL